MLTLAMLAQTVFLSVSALSLFNAHQKLLLVTVTAS